MKIMIQEINKSPIPKIYDNVVQVDYVHYEKTKYSEELKGMTVLQSINGVKTKTLIDLTPDIQITILEAK